MSIEIQDEFTALPVSRQRKWQLRHLARGNCSICGRPAVCRSGYCLAHFVAAREQLAKRHGCRRQHNCLSRRLETKQTQ